MVKNEQETLLTLLNALSWLQIHNIYMGDNCLVGLVVLSATATLEVLGSIPKSSKKCYWVFL